MSATGLPSAPPKGRQNRYPMSTVTLARQLYGDGDAWTPSQIRRYLQRNIPGPTPSVSQIRVWVVDGLAEEQKRWNIESHRRRNNPTSRLDRLRELRAAGLSFSALAVVLRVDYGVEVDREWVRYVLNQAAPSARMLEVLAGRRASRWGTDGRTTRRACATVGHATDRKLEG